MEKRGDVTRLLADVSAGKEGADEALLSLVYDELHSLAGHYMRHERAGHTLQATALVNEAYLRLGGSEKAVTWEGRAHFMRVAARAMRRVLIQHARAKYSDKRGGKMARVPLENAAVFEREPSLDLLALDSALEKLSEVNERMGQVVELRFFGGLSVEDTAKILETSPITVKRDWRAARAWLRTEIAGGDE